MILEREQINRYMRHIIMPEISGPGQKKLVESYVFIRAQNVKNTAALIYYLAASGIGRIGCHFDDPCGFDELLADINDLNSDISLELFPIMIEDVSCSFVIFSGNIEFIGKNTCTISQQKSPVIIALSEGWYGSIKVFKNASDVDSLLPYLPDSTFASLPDTVPGIMDGSLFSACLSGALCALEASKYIIGIEEDTADFLHFDLLNMEFSKLAEEHFSSISKLYSQVQPICNVSVLKDKKVLIVGTGGLGSPAAYALSLSGIGTIGLMDFDIVDISNLNRQILHSKSRIGMSKVESAAVFLKKINPELNIKTYNTALCKENVFEIINDYDVIIDGVDNLPARYLLNDACFLAKKPLIESGVLRFDGLCMTIIPGKSPCYRCLFPEIPAPGSIPSCSESGVLGPLPGIFGFMEAAEAVKLLSGSGTLLTGRMVYLEGLSSDFRVIKMGMNPSCPLCGTNPSISELQQYNFSCETR